MQQFYLLGALIILSWITSLALSGRTPIYEKSRTRNAQRLLFFTAPALFLALYFVGFRPLSAGGDTANYLVAFGRINNPFTATADAGFGTEILFWPMQAILKFALDARGWLVVNYLIVAALTYAAYKKLASGTTITPLIFTLAFTTFFAVYTGNAMRQAISIPLGLIAFHYFFQKENGRFLIFSALSICFHWSSVIVLIYPFFLRIPNKTRYYILVPGVALALSPLITVAADIVIKITDLDWIISKSELYLRGGRISHIDSVWKTLNFWLCLLVYIALISTGVIASAIYQKTSKYLLMIISIMLFSVSYSDISERYMIWFIFSIPFSVAMFFSHIRIPSQIKSVTYVALFSVMALLVFTRDSAVETLGISL